MQIADPLSPFFAFPFLAHLTVDGRPGVIAFGGGGISYFNYVLDALLYYYL